MFSTKAASGCRRGPTRNCTAAPRGQAISGPVDQRDVYRSLFFPLSSMADNWREARQEVARLLKAEDTPSEFHPALESLLDSFDELKEQHEKCWRDAGGMSKLSMTDCRHSASTDRFDSCSSTKAGTAMLMTDGSTRC